MVAPDPLATVVVVCHTHHITSRCALLTFSWPLRGPSGSTIDRTVSDRSCAPRCLVLLRHASRLTQLTLLPPPPPGHPQALPRVQQERRQARATTGTAATMAGAGAPEGLIQAAERALAQTAQTDSASISVLSTHRETRGVSLQGLRCHRCPATSSCGAQLAPEAGSHRSGTLTPNVHHAL